MYATNAMFFRDKLGHLLKSTNNHKPPQVTFKNKNILLTVRKENNNNHKSVPDT